MGGLTLLRPGSSVAAARR